MPEARHCPSCGAPLAPEVEPDAVTVESPVPDLETDPVPRKEDEADVPPVALLASGSNDDTFLNTPYVQRLGAAEPDPLLGQYVTPSSSLSAVKEVDLSARGLGRDSSASFPALNFEAAPPNIAKAPAPQAQPSESDDEGDEPEVRRTPWSTVLLASYASAMTLALAWTLLNQRPREDARAAPEANPAAVVSDSPRQADLSRKVPPAEPIVEELFARFGKPLVAGSLEITPLDVKRQDVQLQRSSALAQPSRREGGKKALVLRLKLRNTTADVAFAPLDEAYLRERGKEVVDTYLETADKERVYPFPLAIESEWSIVGQDFGELRPGESRTVSIASAPDAPPDSAGPFTWRVRLRTGIRRTDVIGVRWPEGPASKKGQP